MKQTPDIAKRYLLAAAFLIALPTLGSLYQGHTGKLLVATYSVAEQGPFHESVIYITRHNLFMAYGYIINKPRTGEENPYPVYYGGPVAPDAKTLFGRDSADRIVFSSAARDIRLLRGYAGWGPLQLNYELGRNGWDVIDYDPALVFDTPPEEIWERARAKVYQRQPPNDEKIL